MVVKSYSRCSLLLAYNSWLRVPIFFERLVVFWENINISVICKFIFLSICFIALIYTTFYPLVSLLMPGQVILFIVMSKIIVWIPLLISFWMILELRLYPGFLIIQFLLKGHLSPKNMCIVGLFHFFRLLSGL